MTARARLILCGAASAAGAGLLVVGVARLTAARDAGLPAVGRVIPVAHRPAGPAISGTTLTGGHLHILSWRGHVVVINFWGSWCVPCREEAPVLRQVAADTRSLGVRFAGIDIRDNPAAALAFERRYRIAYPSISDPDDLISARFRAAAPSATPSTFILDGHGRIAWAWFGATTYGQLELAVTDVVRDPNGRRSSPEGRRHSSPAALPARLVRHASWRSDGSLRRHSGVVLAVGHPSGRSRGAGQQQQRHQRDRGRGACQGDCPGSADRGAAGDQAVHARGVRSASGTERRRRSARGQVQQRTRDR